MGMPPRNPAKLRIDIDVNEYPFQPGRSAGRLRLLILFRSPAIRIYFFELQTA